MVVDDAAMEISHVIRGEDHVSNTPKHILLFEALGHTPPVFAHLPLILNPDGTKMSKRKSQTAVADYIAQGFLREALVNYLAFMGWSPGTEEEVFSLEELTGAVRAGEGPEGRRPLRPGAPRVGQRPVDPPPGGRGPGRRGCCRSSRRRRWRARSTGCPARTRSGRCCRWCASACRPSRPSWTSWASCGWTTWSVDPAAIIPKRWDAATTLTGLAAARAALAAHDAVTWEADELEPPLRALVEARGWKAGDLFMAIRVATTGRTATPPLFDTLVALGRERTLARLDAAIARLTRAG